MSPPVVHTDVVIVGAGFTGLSAAHRMLEAGVDFILLEARNRVGGRVESTVNGLGERVDTGGQYFCVDMPEVTALAKSHGKIFVDSLHEGRALIEPDPDSGHDGLYQRMSVIRDRANDYEPDDPTIAGLSVKDWTLSQPDADDAKAGFLSQIEGLWCQPVDLLPLWYLVSNDRRITNDVPELQYFLDETMHSLADDLAAQLGSSLHISETVTRIRHNIDGVNVSTGVATYSACHVIIAVPPMSAGRLDYDPPLPAQLGHALSVWESGKVIKAIVRYETPFWREAGLSGTVFDLDMPGFYVTDASHDDEHPALVIFIGGGLAIEWSETGQAAVRAAIIAKLSNVFGPRAKHPLDVTIRDWLNDRWSGGAYSDTVRDMDAIDAEETVRAGAGRIKFASSELSSSFPGYIEGAIVAGRATAARVLAASGTLKQYDRPETTKEENGWLDGN